MSMFANSVLKCIVKFPKESLPGMQKDGAHPQVVYSTEEVMFQLLLCSHLTPGGQYRISLSELMRQIGMKVDKSHRMHCAQVLNELLTAERQVCSFRLGIAGAKFDAACVKVPVTIVASLQELSSKYTQIDMAHFETVIACAVANRLNCVKATALLVGICSSLYPYYHDGRTYYAAIIARSTLLGRCACGITTLSKYMSALVGAHIVGYLSGADYGGTNVYCLYGNEAALQLAAERQLDYVQPWRADKRAEQTAKFLPDD